MVITVRYFFILVVLFLSFSCSKENEEPINLKATLAGGVFTTNEFGYTTSAQNGVSVTVEGTSQVIGTTDLIGNYLVDNLVTGTYNIKFSKEDFGTLFIPGFRLVGGDVPTYLNVNLIGQSTTTLSNISLSFDDDKLTIKGTIHHFYPYNIELNGPRVIFFLDSQSNVSGDHYKTAISQIMNFPDGSDFTISALIDRDKFPTGTELHVVGFGVATYDQGYNDVETNRVMYSTLNGDPSNVASIDLP